MEIKDNFSLFNLFLDKRVKIFVDKKSFYVRVLTIREFCLDEELNASYHILTLPLDELEKILPIQINNSFD